MCNMAADLQERVESSDDPTKEVFVSKLFGFGRDIRSARSAL